MAAPVSQGSDLPVSDLPLSRSGRSEKGVGAAGRRLGELFHRDVAGPQVDPQFGTGDAALEPVRVRQRNPSIQLAPLDENRQLQLAQPIRQRRIGRTRDPRHHRDAVAGAPPQRPIVIDDRVGDPDLRGTTPEVQAARRCWTDLGRSN